MDTLRRKVINLAVLAFPLMAWANSGAKQAAIEQYTEVEHPNKGCPENSECDAEMGKLLEQWRTLATRWQSTPKGQALYPKELKIVTSKRGWPGEFYARPAIRTTLAPVLYDSPCAQHRSKVPADSLLRGIGFIKGVKDGAMVITKGETEYSLKLGEVVFLQPVNFYPTAGEKQSYLLPLDEKPLYMDAGKLVSLVESEDLYALLTVDSKGEWDFSNAPMDGFDRYHENSEDVECPKDTSPVPTGFTKSYCRKITNKDGAPAGVVQLYWSCQ